MLTLITARPKKLLCILYYLFVFLCPFELRIHQYHPRAFVGCSSADIEHSARVGKKHSILLLLHSHELIKMKNVKRPKGPLVR